MKRYTVSIFLLGLLIAVGCASIERYDQAFFSAQVQGLSREPQEGENVFINWPDEEGWRLGHKQDAGNIAVAEFVRGKETVENWTELGTMVFVRNLPNVDLDAYLTTIDEESKALCKEVRFVIRSGYPMVVDGRPARIFVVRCKELPNGTSETQVQLIIAGRQAFYNLQRTKRDFNLDEETVRKWSAFLKTVRVCDTRDPDQPCSGIGNITWVTKAPMPTARTYLAVGVVNNKIYAIGGSMGNRGCKHCTTVEEYDPMTDTWTKKASMPTGRDNLAVGVVGGKIYAIGGVGGNGDTLTTVEEYDPDTNKWTMKASMPTARWGLAVSVVNNKIYGICLASEVRRYQREGQARA